MNEIFEHANRLFFMHIPKSGGVAMRDFISASVDKTDTLVLDDGILHTSRKIALGTSRPGQISNSGQIPEAKVLMGHISLSGGLERFPEAQVLTILRLPTLRILSHYIYARTFDLGGIPNSFDRVFVEGAHLPLEAFLNHEPIAMQTDNLQTRFLVWPDGVEQERFIDPSEDAKLIHRAICAIDSIAFVGLYEDPRMWSRLKRRLRTQTEPRRSNETARLPAAMRFRLEESLTPPTFELLQRRTRLDDVVWRHVANRFFGGGEIERLHTYAMMTTFSRFGAICAP